MLFHPAAREIPPLAWILRAQPCPWIDAKNFEIVKVYARATAWLPRKYRKSTDHCDCLKECSFFVRFIHIVFCIYCITLHTCAPSHYITRCKPNN